jgi:hypothetical protein
MADLDKQKNTDQFDVESIPHDFKRIAANWTETISEIF